MWKKSRKKRKSVAKKAKKTPAWVQRELKRIEKRSESVEKKRSRITFKYIKGVLSADFHTKNSTKKGSRMREDRCEKEIKW